MTTPFSINGAHLGSLNVHGEVAPTIKLEGFAIYVFITQWGVSDAVFDFTSANYSTICVYKDISGKCIPVEY